jgi:hypothetical protein
MNRKPGWQLKITLFIAGALGAAGSASAVAGTHTVREVKIPGNGVAQIHLDGVPPKGALEFDYVRDIVQLSIQNSTIYPAKILHSDSGDEAFSKVFAYQYAPNLVRIRFTVGGKADVYRGKVKLEQKGKMLTVRFPAAIADQKGQADREQSLLAKVLGQAASVGNPVAEQPVAPEIKATEPVAIPAAESKPAKLTGARVNPAPQLGGARSSVSPMRSLFAMFLVVGGLGMVLVYVKSRKKGVPGKRNGDSWFSQVLSGAKRNTSYIEVLASHALGPKQSITVVRIRDQKFVLGVTQDSVQLITQLDSDEADLDVLEDPKVADSIGKLFGSKPKSMPAVPGSALLNPEPVIKIPEPAIDLGASFNSLLKSSTGAGAVIARSAYQQQAPAAEAPIQKGSGIRNRLRQQVQEMGKI